jgi:hypothetical protein
MDSAKPAVAIQHPARKMTFEHVAAMTMTAICINIRM